MPGIPAFMDQTSTGEQVLEHLKKNLSLDFFDLYAREHNDVIKDKIATSVINHETIDAVMEEFIFDNARSEFDRMVRSRGYSKVYADHILCPGMLAYAVEKGHFSTEEIRKIPFDHGDNLRSYIEEHYIPDLPKRLREKLLNPPKLEQNGGYSAHADCLGHCCDCD
jgi:hypothetical protein